MNHVHACPECYEHVHCGEDCAIEPDLGTTPAGVPFAHHDVCASCARAAMSPSDSALAVAFNAWVEWPGDRADNSEAAETLRDLADVWKVRGLAVFDGLECLPTDKGADLLDRARKAGVL
jgi:hypothetical protein